MFQLIETIIHEFRNCFKREKTWNWFIVIIIGLMVRTYHLGVTNIISALRLEPRLYHTMLKFFRSTAYKVDDVYTRWIETATKNEHLVYIAGRLLLLGDHLKMPKDGRRMPSVQTLHQESQNSGKASYIEGHTIAHVGAVITKNGISRSLPLSTELQESPPKIEGTDKPDGDTLVTQMVNLAVGVASALGGKLTVIALDAYFAKASAFEAAGKVLDETGRRLLEIVTRAPSDTVAYTIPTPKLKKGRGRPQIYGEKVRLYDLYNDMSNFVETTMVLYGKQTKVRYLCRDLLWKPTKGLIRFVVVELNGTDRCVLMSSSLDMSSEEIITAYALRFKIEQSFNEQKHDMGCYSYHFWTTALPKKSKWKKIEQPTDEKSLRLIKSTKKAIDSYMCMCTIAAGIITIIGFMHNRDIWQHYPGWIKTRRSVFPSIAVVKETLAYVLPIYMRFNSNSLIASVIGMKQRVVEFLYKDVG